MNEESTPKVLVELAETVDGTIEEHGSLPDGSGYATMSMPLPRDHWLTANPDVFEVPPMPFRIGTDRPQRATWITGIRAAAKYAIRASTMNGKENDFDPDAMVQNMIVGMIGYFTPDGTSKL
jgi:hypothetical protein